MLGRGKSDEVEPRMRLTLDGVHERVRSALQGMQLPFYVDDDGDYVVSHGSTKLLVMPRRNSGNDHLLVLLQALVVYEVPLSVDLYRYVATKSSDFVFGALSLKEVDGTATIYFQHAVLGDFLDDEEMDVALAVVASTADGLDDEMLRFGGRRAAD